MDGDRRITWVTGDARPGPRQTIGVLELREDGSCRAAFAERVEVDGRCHIMLARRAWGPKPTRGTKWWSLVLNEAGKVFTIRNGSCGDPLLLADVPAIIEGLESLDLHTEDTMLAVDDAPSVFPWHRRS